MTRLLASLALAGVSSVAVAAPPITEPVRVTVANPVVPVEVGNADPIAVRVTPDTDAAREPFVSRFQIPGHVGNICSGTFVVPAGKRAVIEGLSAQALLSTGAQLISAGLAEFSGNRIVVTPGFNYTASTSVIGIANQTLHLYSDANLLPCVQTWGGVTGDFVTVTLTGYFVTK